MLPSEELPKKSVANLWRDSHGGLYNICGLGVDFGKRGEITNLIKKPEKRPKCNNDFLALVDKRDRSVRRCFKFGLGHGKVCNYERTFYGESILRRTGIMNIALIVC